MNSGIHASKNNDQKWSEGVQVLDFHTLPKDMNYGHMLLQRLQKNLKFIGNSHLKQSVTNYGMFVAVMDKSVLMTQNCPL